MKSLSNETAPCNSSVFEVAGDDEFGTPIFEDEEEEAAEGDAEATTRAVDPVTSATNSDDDDGPDPTTYTSRGPIEQVTQPSSAASEETPVLVEEEATSTREALRHIRRRHPSQQMLGNLNERVTQSKVTSIAGFAHSAFVASFEPKDVGHALSDSNWVNAMHEEFENFERNQVWVLVEPPPALIPLEPSRFSRTSKVKMGW